MTTPTRVAVAATSTMSSHASRLSSRRWRVGFAVVLALLLIGGEVCRVGAAPGGGGFGGGGMAGHGSSMGHFGGPGSGGGGNREGHHFDGRSFDGRSAHRDHRRLIIPYYTPLPYDPYYYDAYCDPWSPYYYPPYC